MPIARLCSQFLQFDARAKLNLADLSYALEQELRGVEEDNACHQAALATYEHELRHLKSVLLVLLFVWCAYFRMLGLYVHVHVCAGWCRSKSSPSDRS